jgi:hypothetical protein
MLFALCCPVIVFVDASTASYVTAYVASSLATDAVGVQCAGNAVGRIAATTMTVYYESASRQYLLPGARRTNAMDRSKIRSRLKHNHEHERATEHATEHVTEDATEDATEHAIESDLESDHPCHPN